MLEEETQAILDTAAAQLGVPITLEDRDFRLLAHTDHTGVIDEFRRAMIIGRRATPEVRKWFEQWEPPSARQPFPTPSDVGLGVLGRWCVPVHFRDTALGYLWVLNTRDIAEDELHPVVDAAEQIGTVLYRRRITSQADAELLRLLLTPSTGDDVLAAEVRALGALAGRGPVAVVVAGPARAEESQPVVLSDLALVVQRATEQAPPGTVLSGMITGAGVFLTVLRKPSDLGPAKRLAESVRLLSTQVTHNFEVVAAIGGAKEFDDAHESYAEARRTLRMVRAMNDLGPIAQWDELGVFRALALLPSAALDRDVVDPRVRDLLANNDLASTAEVFLDLAGDVQGTAARLFIHRTTLYQRLDRITTQFKLDLRRNGEHRLITHLGLKLARVGTD